MNIITIRQQIAMLVFINVVCLFLHGWVDFAGAVDQLTDGTDDAASEIRATIMEIDLNKNMMVVAEKVVLLPFTLQDNVKIYSTEFLDSNGHAITVDVFKKGDRVLVEGKEISSEGIRARKIKLLASAGANRRKVKNISGNESEQKDLPTLQGGVWKN